MIHTDPIEILVQDQLDQWDFDYSEHEVELPADTDIELIGPEMYTSWKLPGVDNRAVIKETYPHPTKPDVIVALFEMK